MREFRIRNSFRISPYGFLLSRTVSKSGEWKGCSITGNGLLHVTTINPGYSITKLTIGKMLLIGYKSKLNFIVCYQVN